MAIWRLTEGLAEMNYSKQIDRDAFRGGYSDGYHNYPLFAGDWPINAYSRGFWEGFLDGACNCGYRHPENMPCPRKTGD